MRARRPIFTVAGVLAIGSAVLTFAGTAIAGPVGGGRYVGERGYYSGSGVAVALQVGPTGRALVGTNGGSYIAGGEGCAGRGRLRLLKRGRRVRIDRKGRFSFGVRRIGYRLRVRGRFADPHTVRIVYRVRPASAFCSPGPLAVRLHRKGAPPFNGCRSQRAKTLLESARGRIFSQRKVFGFEFRPVAYGCLDEVNKRIVLGEDGYDAFAGEGHDLEHFRLSGPYAGFIDNVAGPAGGADSAVRVDLRDGSRVTPCDPTNYLDHYIGDLELKDNGSIACIEGHLESRGDAKSVIEVWASDGLGTRRLDRGRSIDDESLKLAGSMLTWDNDGQIRSAVLE